MDLYRMLPAEICSKIHVFYCIEKYKELIEYNPLNVVGIIRKIRGSVFEYNNFFESTDCCIEVPMLSKKESRRLCLDILGYSLELMNGSDIFELILEYDVSINLSYEMFKLCISKIDECYVSYLMNCHVSCMHITKETIMMSIDRCNGVFLVSLVSSSVIIPYLNSCVLLYIIKKIDVNCIVDIIEISHTWKYINGEIVEYAVTNNKSGTILGYEIICDYITPELIKTAISKSPHAMPPIIYYNHIYPLINTEIFEYAIDTCSSVEFIICNPLSFPYLSREILKKSIPKIRIFNIVYLFEYEAVRSLIDSEIFKLMIINSCLSDTYKIVMSLRAVLTEEILYTAVDKIWNSKDIYKLMVKNDAHMSCRILNRSVNKMEFGYVYKVFNSKFFIRYMSENVIKIAMRSFGEANTYLILNSVNVEPFLNSSLIEYAIINLSDEIVCKIVSNRKLSKHMTESTLNIIKYTCNNVDAIMQLLLLTI